MVLGICWGKEKLHVNGLPEWVGTNTGKPCTRVVWCVCVQPCVSMRGYRKSADYLCTKCPFKLTALDTHSSGIFIIILRRVHF